MKMPKPSLTPVTVPTRDSDGRSASRGLGGGGALVAVTAAVAAGGGRRDAEKIGRSRVVDNVASGSAHSGLALSGRSGAAGGGATTPAVGAGESQSCAPGGSVRSPFVSGVFVSNPAAVSADSVVG